MGSCSAAGTRTRPLAGLLETRATHSDYISVIDNCKNGECSSHRGGTMNVRTPLTLRRIRHLLAAGAAVTALGLTPFVPAAGTLSAGQPGVAHAAPTCNLNSANGAIQHVIYVQFDNVHFTRDNPNIPSDLEQ